MTADAVVIRPGTAAEVAAALKEASNAGQSLIIRGAGSKDGYGRTPSRIDVILDMQRLNHIVAHEHGDMTATIEAGASLRHVNVALALHGQTLPLDPPFADRATIGGLLATNDSGPLRHRYGTPRDLVIGVQLATTDGTLAKAGGQVVKNVAGYDLSKLIAGSFGSIAAIVSATFKLAPRPAASKTLRLHVRDIEALSAAIRTVMASQLEPVAFEVRAESVPDVVQAFKPAVLVRFASLPEVVNAQVEHAQAGLGACTTSMEVLDGEAERSLWKRHASELWDSPGAIVRASWLPANIGSALGELEQSATAGHAVVSLAGRAAVGAGHIRIEGDTSAQADVVRQLRASRIFGNIVIVRGSPELKAGVDAWGSQSDRQPLFDSLKRALDPNGTLNAGRGPL
ncbi:MAG TPA: FAD-binding oxidoreductase [Vicinamibacterales bacterium]|nr:FAD-binding oxidoreductase [Vicinamibacterales bacterium]